jgi:sporulation protein YlmC with PRC-barrel domain
MFRTAMLVSAIALGAAGVAQAADTRSSAAPAVPTTSAAQPVLPGSADANKLIGQDIKNADNDSIGEVNSVRIGADGKVNAVIVGVGGFLGMGEREVALDWKDLRVSEDGRKVTANMTKEQLKALPEYKYSDASYRGRVFTEATPSDSRPGVGAPGAVAERDAATPRDRRTAAAARGDFNAQGELSGSALIGATVKNAANETVGEVEDVFLDQNGSVKALIVSVGGAMGIGSKDVLMGWKDLKVGRQQDKLVLTTSATKDSLKGMPEYKK